MPTEQVLAYRLNLHESINDYLYCADLYDVSDFYRVKTSDILDKIERFKQRKEGYPVNSILNDIFGARIIVSSEEIEKVMESLDDWQQKYELKNWYLRNKDEYTGLHIYLKIPVIFIILGRLQIGDKKMLKEISKAILNINVIL